MSLRLSLCSTVVPPPGLHSGTLNGTLLRPVLPVFLKHAVEAAGEVDAAVVLAVSG